VTKFLLGDLHSVVLSPIEYTSSFPLYGEHAGKYYLSTEYCWN